MQLVGNSCKTLEISLHNLGDTSCLLHQLEPVFEPAFATLSLLTSVAHQNNDFLLSEIRKQSQFFQFKVSLQSWHNYLLSTWTRQNKRVHFSNIFSTSQSVAVSNFINGPFGIPEQLAVEKLLKVKGYIKGFKNC